ncbi:hypothetical protein PTTG_04302 [Puccinia triticina 1-1 BBBD Race 1]|uniref:Uncharacterized protein n=1 Tax=Puccinia triticina (isolate 1-1 / race 1 (BBBD)) TaxID=630390 RepID=A0A180GPA0_PUCT1|nr:hypothetical protein PTTG_04302 [Puccinia triticina 1-1 BBBD Race 1]
MAGKLIATNDGKTPILTYNQHSVARLREIGEEGFEFANKASVLGLGIVVKREEVANGNDRCLEVTMEHSDWDSQERRHKTFKVKYVIPGSKNFIKTHSLYVVGRECEIAGVLVDFDIENKMAIILVNDCSITSGHQPSRASGSASPGKPGVHGKGRNILKLGSEDLASPATTPTHSPAKRTFAKISPTAGPSKSKGKEKATDGEESEDEAEDDGEVDIEPEEEEEDNSAPKPARGRRRKAILKDAAKRLKKL